jgi:hypothetical protein
MLATPLRPLRSLLAVSTLAALGCAAPVVPPVPPREPEPAADLADARTLLWQGRSEEALAWLDGQGWRATGSIAAERLRQDVALGRGERAQLAAELEDAAAELGESADLVYLRARLLSDPERRLRALEDGARAHPDHPWLALGAAAVRQEFGDWARADAWLAGVVAEPGSAAFRRLLLARQLAHSGRSFSAWRLLETDAFQRGHSEALLELLRIAEDLPGDRHRTRARAEYAVRAAAAEPDRGLAMDRVIERFLADESGRSRTSLEDALEDLDRWSELAGVPSGWQRQPRYVLGDLAELVQPEAFRGGVSSAWLDHGRFLLIGRAPGRGVDWLYLQDAHRLALPAGPGRPAVEVIVAQRGLEPEDRTIPGGAPFHGFFVRLDLVERAARVHERSVAAVGPPSAWSAPPPATVRSGGRLETFDLATRLRARRLAAGGATARDLELLHLVLHECGHLPETLPWARDGVPWLGVAPAVLRSLLRYEDPILFLEERAQLRALACGLETEWAFAELLDRSLTPRDPYYRPYRNLLLELVERGEAAGLPPLHAWDRLPPGRLAQLAHALLVERSLQPLPAGLAASALRGLDASDAFDQLPTADLAALLEHDREIDS